MTSSKSLPNHKHFCIISVPKVLHLPKTSVAYTMDIFVGSLPFKLKEKELREIFEKYGVVITVKIVIDKITRQSKGFGFVEMPNLDEAKSAIEALNGVEVDGRPLIVNPSQKNSESGNSSGGTGNSGRGGNRYQPRSNDNFDKKNHHGDDRRGSSGGSHSGKSHSGGSHSGGSHSGKSSFGSDNYKKGGFKKDFKRNDRNWRDKNDNY
jgi:RNA recognition motif-containing protein